MGPTPIPNLTGGAGGAAGPSSAELHGGSVGFDSSDWTVATGNARASGFDTQTLLIVGGLALVALLLWKKL